MTAPQSQTPRMMSSTEDQKRLAFLQALDDAPFEVTEWEARFLDSILTGPHWTEFTDRQRAKIDQMRKSYEHRVVGVQASACSGDTLKRGLQLPEPQPGKCHFAKKDDDRKWTRCGEPATHKFTNGLELCAECFERYAAGKRKFQEAKARR